MEFSRILEWVAFPVSGDLPKPGIEPWSPALQVDFLLAQPPGKPKNTGMGSLSLLHWIFPIPGIKPVSFIVGGFFTNWAIRETPKQHIKWPNFGKKEKNSFKCRLYHKHVISGYIYLVISDTVSLLSLSFLLKLFAVSMYYRCKSFCGSECLACEAGV